MGASPKPPGTGVGNEPNVERVRTAATPAAGTVAPDTDRDPEQRLRAALEASTRTEETLSALARAVQQVTSGVSGAQEANERLSVELATARELLAEANQQRLVLEQRAALLEESLRRSDLALTQLRRESEQERQFMVEEQDRFFAGLLSEHEEAIAALRREIHELRNQSPDRVPPGEKKTLPGVPRAPEPSPEVASLRVEIGGLLAERQRSRELMRRVQAQRDDAQERANRLEREHEEAKAEIARLSALLKAPPELTAALGLQDLLQSKQTAPGLGGRRTEPQQWAAKEPAADQHQRVTAPPSAEALEAALLASRKPSPPPLPVVDAGPTIETKMGGPPPTPLLRKQDPHRRAIGGYSIGPEEIEPERVGARPASKPPRG